MSKKNEAHSKPKLIRGKLSAFFICLAISSFLWLTHRLNTTYNYSLTIPVKFINLPANKLLIQNLPENLRFDIKTNGLKLFFILLKKPFQNITIDFNTLKSDNKMQAYCISSGNINLKNSVNFDVDVKKISPDTLFFASKKGLSKNVAVKPLLYITPDKGIVLSKPSVTPSYITISGDSSLVKNIDSISTAPLYLNQLNKNFNGKLSLIKPNDNIYLNISEINVSISAEKLIEKEIELPVEIINAPPGKTFKLFPSKVKINFACPAGDFEDINEDSFKAVINFEKQLKNSTKLPVELIITPTQVNVLSISPLNIDYLIYKSK